MKTLIVYFSKKGFIREVAERINVSLNGLSDIVDLAKSNPSDIADYDTVIVAAAFIAGKLSKKITSFCSTREFELINKNLYLAVGGLDEKNFKVSVDQNFLNALTVAALDIVHVGGRYLPKDHNPLVCYIMRKINKSSDAVYLEKWDAVDDLIRQIKAGGK